MRIGYIVPEHGTLSEDEATFAEQHGFYWLEFVYDEFGEKQVAQKEALRATLKKHNLSICAIGVWRREYLDPDKGKAHVKQLQTAINYAADMECPVVVTGGSVLKDQPIAEAQDQFIKMFKPICKEATEKGVKIALYLGHGNNVLDVPKGTDRLLDGLPEVGIKFDPANPTFRGGDWTPFVHKYADRFFHVHIKDQILIGKELIELPPAGMGDIQWGKLIALLYQHNYRGVMSVEPHGKLWGHQGALRRQCILMSRNHVKQFLISDL
ncbi:MAG: sugar phosphate isomerase/epimerase [Planctomycetota bacterium]